MKKVNKENTFLTIWIFCIVLLTLLFPISFIRGTRAYFDGNMSGQIGASYQIKYVSNFPSELNKEVKSYTDSVVSEIYIVTDNAFEADGYEFVNWNTKSDGTGKVYEVKEVYTDKLNLTLYAQWKKIEVIVISYGDVSLNGAIDENDYLLVENHVSGIKQLTGQALLNADVNADGKVDLVDADIIKQAYFGTDGYVGILPSGPILVYEIYEEEIDKEPDSPDNSTEGDNLGSGGNEDSSDGESDIDKPSIDDDMENDNPSGGGDGTIGDNSSSSATSSGENNNSGDIEQGSSGNNNNSGGGTNNGGSTGSGNGSSGSNNNGSSSGNGSGSGSSNKPSTGNSNDDKKDELPEEEDEEVVESDKNNDVVQDKDNISSEKEEKNAGDSIVYVVIIVFGICLLSFRLILHVIYKFRQKNKNPDVEDE